jgi:alginate O-acetyltransferase complex protein AlgI
MSTSPALVLAFVPAVVAMFFACGRWPWLSQSVLVVASLVFIVTLDRATVPPLLGTLLVTYVVGLALGANGGKAHARRNALAFAAVAGNLAVLAYYKWTSAVLPLGLSFFTLQQVIYLLDIWRGDPPARRLLDYLTLVTFFPKLAAGPFVRHVTFLGQFARERFRLGAEDVTWGLALITIGVLKKG